MDDAVSLLGERQARENQNYHGYGGHVLTFPVEKGRSMNVVAFTSARSWPHKDMIVRSTKEGMYADFEGWSAHVRSIMKLMTKPDIWALFNHLPADTYTNGRICMLGDAAHASTPHQGIFPSFSPTSHLNSLLTATKAPGPGWRWRTCMSCLIFLVK